MTRPAVAVFGSSEPCPGEPLYEAARDLGRALARGGYAVVTGGYGGVMEGASRGAREAGGSTFGVLCAWFDNRNANPYLDGSMVAPDLHDRTRELIDRSWAFVVLDGKAGTLAELAFLWALERAGRLSDRPVVLFGDAWTDTVARLADAGRLEPSQIAMCRHASTPDEVVTLLDASRPERR